MVRSGVYDQERDLMKRILAAPLLAIWLIPLAVLARGPKADAPIQVPISSRFLGADGKTYLLSGTLSLSVEGVTPIPVPDPLALSYLTMAPAVVAPGGSAAVTVVLTRKAGDAVSVALRSADPLGQVAPALTVPAGSDHGTAAVTTSAAITTERLIGITATLNGQSRAANLTVRPVAPIPVPGPPGAGAAPRVDEYRLADGSPLVGLPAFSSEVRLVGRGFGPTPGRVVWQGAPLTILQWSDLLVRVRMPPASVQGQNEFTLFRADGGFCNMQAPLDMRTPPPAARR